MRRSNARKAWMINPKAATGSIISQPPRDGEHEGESHPPSLGGPSSSDVQCRHPWLDAMNAGGGMDHPEPPHLGDQP